MFSFGHSPAGRLDHCNCNHDPRPEEDQHDECDAEDHPTDDGWKCEIIYSQGSRMPRSYRSDTRTIQISGSYRRYEKISRTDLTTTTFYNNIAVQKFNSYKVLGCFVILMRVQCFLFCICMCALSFNATCRQFLIIFTLFYMHVLYIGHSPMLPHVF